MRGQMSSSSPIREGMPLKYQIWDHRCGQLDMAHALPADLGPGDLYAAAVADLTLVADLLILAAVALPVLGGSKDPLAEQAVPLRLQSTIVDGLRLLDLAVGPLADLLRGGNTDLDGVKLSVTHMLDRSSLSITYPDRPGTRRPHRPRSHRRRLPQGRHRRSRPSG